MKRMLLAAIAAATALVPAAALAQERGEHRENGGWMRPDNFRAQGGQGWQRPQGQPQDRGDWERPQGQPRDGGNGQRPQANRGWMQPQGVPQAMDRGDWRRPEGQPRPAFEQPQGTRPPVQPQRDWRGGPRADWQNRNPQAWQDRRWDDRGGSQWNGARDWGRHDGYRGWNDHRNWDRADRWRGNGGAWDNGWRNDHRYDWRAYRDYNRSLYRLPRYYPPARWSYGYRRFSVGYRLDSFLFAQQYWISDPSSYRLPDVWGPYRWVRYYDDALLVDVDTGAVVDVIYGIFW